VQILFFLKSSDQQVTVSGIDVPVEVSEIFAGTVFTMIREFDTGACLAGSALGQKLTAEHTFRHDRKVFEASEEVGRKQHRTAAGVMVRTDQRELAGDWLS
jgi:hypothetical protein